MKRLFCLIFGVVLLTPDSLFSQSVDDVINKHVDALGGQKALQEIKTLRIEATIVQRDSVEIPISMTFKRTGMIYVEITLDGLTQRTAFDGKEGWAFNPISGAATIEKLPDTAAHEIQGQADFEGKLVNYKSKGSKVELLGKENLGSTEVYNIKLTDQFSGVTYFFVQASSYLLMKEKTIRKVDGMEIEVETNYGDYIKTGNILFAHSIEYVSTVDSQASSIRMIIKNMEINPIVPDVLFSMPK